MAVEPHEFVETVGVSGNAQLHWVRGWAVEGQREPDLIAARDAIDLGRRVAGLGREDISLDVQEPDWRFVTILRL